MNISLNEDEQILRGAIRDLTVSLAADGATLERAWQAYSELGLCAVDVPETLGGAEMGIAALAVACAAIAESKPAWAICMGVHNLSLRQAALHNAAEKGQMMTLASGEAYAAANVTPTGSPRTLVWDALRVQHFFVGSHGACTPIPIETPAANTHSAEFFDGARLLAVDDSSTIQADWAAWDLIWAAVSLGVARGAFRTLVEYSQEREQFGRPLSAFQAIQWMLADSSAELDGAAVLVDRAIRRPSTAVHAARAALFASEAAVKIADRAIQAHGGYGFTMEYLPQEFWRSAHQLHDILAADAAKRTLR
ncbi:MAG: acyl-CoA dehydrogenase family protein [Bradymonadia bacterium]